MIAGCILFWNEILDTSSCDQIVANPSRPVMTGTRQELLGLLSDVKELQDKRNWPRDGQRGFDITLPCGCDKLVREDDDIPITDLYCQCGRYIMMKVKADEAQ